MRAAGAGLTQHSRRRYETVVEQILQLVEGERLDQGQALPTERELAERFGVSRNVIRQAFGVLEERGLLRSVRGSGRYLRDIGAATALGPRAAAELASITDLLEARALIEVQVAELACQRRTLTQAEEILQLAGQLNDWEDNLAFHCAIAAATHNFVLERLVREQAELAGELHQREHYADPEELRRMRAEHVAIAHAIMGRDVDQAGALQREHLYRTRRIVLSHAVATETS